MPKNIVFLYFLSKKEGNLKVLTNNIYKEVKLLYRVIGDI